MQGPAPVNIGGTGRLRRAQKKAECTGMTRADGGRHETGRLGEDIALEYLLQRGFKLIERNWRCRHKEVDLIMEGDDGLHIVEVRTMKEPVQVEPEMTVCARKQLNLRTAAEAWIRIKGENAPVLPCAAGRGAGLRVRAGESHAGRTGRTRGAAEGLAGRGGTSPGKPALRAAAPAGRGRLHAGRLCGSGARAFPA